MRWGNAPAVCLIGSQISQAEDEVESILGFAIGGDGGLGFKKGF